jgi:hypothetical protein
MALCCLMGKRLLENLFSFCRNRSMQAVAALSDKFLKVQYHCQGKQFRPVKHSVQCNMALAVVVLYILSY